MELSACRCWGVKKIVIGALLLLNAFVWPQWLGIDGWVKFFAVILVLLGILKLVLPPCQNCCETPKAKKKK